MTSRDKSRMDCSKQATSTESSMFAKQLAEVSMGHELPLPVGCASACEKIAIDNRVYFFSLKVCYNYILKSILHLISKNTQILSVKLLSCQR